MMNRFYQVLSNINLRQIVFNEFHTTSPINAWAKDKNPRKFIANNKTLFPPQAIGEERRPAFVCHQKCNIKYSLDKLWYLACFVRGMTVDEALKQLSFINKKGATVIKQVIEEAREKAVSENHVEFRSNLWISVSRAEKGPHIKGIRRHARGRMGEVRYGYCHYMVALEEGTPPKDYYKKDNLTPSQQIEKWLEQMRKRKIINSL